jgi:hypothetical protein
VTFLFSSHRDDASISHSGDPRFDYGPGTDQSENCSLVLLSTSRKIHVYPPQHTYLSCIIIIIIIVIDRLYGLVVRVPG